MSCVCAQTRAMSCEFGSTYVVGCWLAHTSCGNSARAWQKPIGDVAKDGRPIRSGCRLESRPESVVLSPGAAGRRVTLWRPVSRGARAAGEAAQQARAQQELFSQQPGAHTHLTQVRRFIGEGCRPSQLSWSRPNDVRCLRRATFANLRRARTIGWARLGGSTIGSGYTSDDGRFPIKSGDRHCRPRMPSAKADRAPCATCRRAPPSRRSCARPRHARVRATCARYPRAPAHAARARAHLPPIAAGCRKGSRRRTPLRSNTSTAIPDPTT